MSPLFREQAIRARANSWLGSVRLRSSWPMYGAQFCSVLLVAALLALALLGSVSRRAHLPGILVPRDGALTVQSSAAGIVAELRVAEGQRVRAGELLLVVDSEHLGANGSAVRTTSGEMGDIIARRLDSVALQRQLHQQNHDDRARALAARLRLFQDQIKQAEAEAAILVRRVQLAKEALDRQEALVRAGYVSAAQVQVKTEELLDVEARLQAARRAITSLKSEYGAAEAEGAAASNQLKLQLAELERAEETAKQELVELSAKGRTAVVAPVDGIVAATELVAGQTVQPGQQLLTILRASSSTTGGEAKLVAHLYAPSRSAGFVKDGQPVQMRLDAFPFQKFGFLPGRVRKVSKAPFSATELPPHVAQQLAARIGPQESGLFRLVIEIDPPRSGEPMPLKPGDTLEADVTLETRAIWEWMFEPLIRLRRLA